MTRTAIFSSLIASLLATGWAAAQPSEQPAAPATAPNAAAAPPIRIAASFVPIHVLTQNVVGDAPGVTLDLVIAPTTGCPHGYSVTPDDVRTLSRANVLVTLGMGMDDVLAERVRQLNAAAKIIVCSKGAAATPARPAAACPHCGGHHGPDENHAHEPNGIQGDNPHVWTSVANAIILTQNIAAGLSEADPGRASFYEANAKAYIERLRTLQQEAAKAAAGFKHRRVLALHDSLDPMAKELGLELLGVIQEHSGQQPSTARLRQMIQLVRKEQQNGPVLILSEPQFADQSAELIARETGAPLLRIDTLASAAGVPAKDAYETTYRANLAKLAGVLR